MRPKGMELLAKLSNLVTVVEDAVSSLRANKFEGFHGTPEDREHFEVILNTVIYDLEMALSKSRGKT